MTNLEALDILGQPEKYYCGKDWMNAMWVIRKAIQPRLNYDGGENEKQLNTTANKDKQDYIKRVRGNELCWYVLRYDKKTTAYNNDIVFKTYDEAYKEFLDTYPKYENECIELIFSPKEGDNLFFDNVLMYRKEIIIK